MVEINEAFELSSALFGRVMKKRGSRNGVFDRPTVGRDTRTWTHEAGRASDEIRPPEVAVVVAMEESLKEGVVAADVFEAAHSLMLLPYPNGSREDIVADTL